MTMQLPGGPFGSEQTQAPRLGMMPMRRVRGVTLS